MNTQKHFAGLNHAHFWREQKLCGFSTGASPHGPIDIRAVPNSLQETEVSGKNFFDSELGRLFNHNNDRTLGPIPYWFARDPNARNVFVNQALNFVNTAPPALVAKMTEQLRAKPESERTFELLDQLTRQDAWINALGSINFTDAPTANFRTASTPLNLLKDLPLNDRKSIFEAYVTSYIPAAVRSRRLPSVFTPDGSAPNAEVIDALRMMTGMLPPPAPTVANTSRDLARESLQHHFFTRCSTNNTQLVDDYRRNLADQRRYQDQARAHREDPSSVPLPREPISLFVGARNLDVFSPQVLEQLRQVDLGHNQVATNVIDNLSRLESETRVRESVGFLDRMEGWEKMAFIGLLAYFGMKHKKAAGGLFLAYLGVKYVGGIQDPLGSGMLAVREAMASVRGVSTSVRRRVGLGGSATPEEIANDMVRFASREDLHGVQEEAEVLTLLNGFNLNRVAAAFNTDGPPGSPWRLNLTMLFGNSRDIPAYLRNNDRAQQAAQSMAYMLFSRFREQNPSDPDVRLVVERMARRDARCNWMQQLCNDPVLARAYQNCVVRGKMLAAGDDRTVLKFIQDQLIDRSELPPNPTVVPPVRPGLPQVSNISVPSLPVPPGIAGITRPVTLVAPGTPGAINAPVSLAGPGIQSMPLPMMLAPPAGPNLSVPLMPAPPGSTAVVNVPVTPIAPGQSGIMVPAALAPAGYANIGQAHRFALPGEPSITIPMVLAGGGQPAIGVPMVRVVAPASSISVPVTTVPNGGPSIQVPVQMTPP